MPLKSIRVLDLTRLLPGPYCTMILADFGAEVIKIEEPNKGDYAREDQPLIDEDGAVFHSLNRNKKSICLNLKDKEDKEAFLQLIATADVVVESFRPGVMKRLGLNYEVLKEIKPDIIYCAITGFGQTGPYANRPGHDINYISFAGLLHLMGEKNGLPTTPATQIADIGGGALPAVIGILLAIIERNQSGNGQFVDISMMDGVVSWMQTILPKYFVNQEEMNRGELPLSGGKACYGVYRTKDDKYLSVGALEDRFWHSFCRTIEKEEFIPLLDAPAQEQERLRKQIQGIIETKPRDEWLDLFSDLDTCVSPVLTVEEMIQDPQVNAREMIQNVEHEDKGKIKQIGVPIKLSRTPGQLKSRAPKLGEHTEEILKELRIKNI